MAAVKRKLHGVRVLLHSIACLLRTARATRDAVGKSYPAVEETSHAVEESSHGIYVFVPRLPARTGRGGGRNAGRRGACRGVGEGTGGVLRALNMLLSMFGAICRPFSCKSRIFFSHLQSAAKKVEKFFRGVNRLF